MRQAHGRLVASASHEQGDPSLTVWCTTLPVNHLEGHPGNVRSLLLSAVLLTLVLSNACTPARQSKTPVAAKPTPTPVPSPTPARADRAESIKAEWTNYFTFTEHSIPPRNREEHGYNLEASYPQISSKKSEVRRFNKWIRNKVLGYANLFRRLADVEQRRKKKQRPTLWGLELYYVVYYSNERLVSLRLTHELMEAGQMHPIDYYETINFDLKRGRQLRANDIFKRGYLKQLSRYSRKHLTEHYETNDEWVNGGTKPTLDNFTNWNIVPHGVLLSFEDYQVGAHSFGQPEFVVPFSALSTTIRPNILRRLVVSK